VTRLTVATLLVLPEDRARLATTLASANSELERTQAAVDELPDLGKLVDRECPQL
jgi:hypothetical protein